MKQAKKFYLEEKDLESLKEKAKNQGFKGRGMLSKYIRKVARENIVFLDQNTKSVLKLFGEVMNGEKA